VPSTARRLAIEVIQRVEQGGAFLNLALDGALRSAGAIEPREAALTTELSYGTVRWQQELDRAIEAHSARPLAEMDGPVRAVLRLGAFELLHHPTVPARAVVHQAVELCKELRAPNASGFVNAILRRLSEVRASPPLPSQESDPIGRIAALTSHPRWLVERWSRALGLEETEALCRANQTQARATVRRNRKRATLEEAQAALLADGLTSEPGLYSPDALVLQEGAPPALDLEGHAQGLFQAQDEAAQLVSLYAAPSAGARVLDACAAPGGKACHLAELVGPEGRVVAIDLHARKTKIIAEAARRMGYLNLEARAADATLPLPGEGPESFDLILLDAPCSGLGTLRRHPELKLRRTPEDIDRLATLQLRLLNALAPLCKKGGLLVFALCTFTPEECDETITRFLAAHPDFVREAPPPGWARPAAQALIRADGALLALPNRSGTDGFFAIRMRRAANDAKSRN
jgi:16S rRNA (cytosine967-C5)-methyltransferase